MAVNVTQSTNFLFTIPCGEVTFNLNIAAASESEAAQKLISALEKAQQELKAMVKVRSN